MKWNQQYQNYGSHMSINNLIRCTPKSVPWSKKTTQMCKSKQQPKILKNKQEKKMADLPNKTEVLNKQI